MKRTPPSTQRRRNISDASSGFPERNRVVLYANIDDDSEPEKVLAQLRAYAEARDWDVPEGFTHLDHGPACRSRRERPGWYEVSCLLREGAAEGVVAPAEAQIATSHLERREFCDWLASIQKFASYPQEPGRPAVGFEEVEGAGT